MLTFDQWNTKVSAGLAEMLLEELGATRVLPTGTSATGADATRALGNGAEAGARERAYARALENPREASRMASKFVTKGYRHLQTAHSEIEQGMVSIGKIIDLARNATKKKISDEQFADALEVVRLSLDTKNDKEHPVKRLAGMKDALHGHLAEIEGLIDRINTAQRQSVNYGGTGIV